MENTWPGCLPLGSPGVLRGAPGELGGGRPGLEAPQEAAACSWGGGVQAGGRKWMICEQNWA